MPSKPTTTFVCVYNNKEEFQTMFSSLLNKIATIDRVNALSINNTDNIYKSYAKACNSEIKKNIGIIGDILVFAHQDIASNDTDFIDSIINQLSVNSNQIIGFAGMTSERKVLSNLRYQDTLKFITQNQLSLPTDAESIDECCFAITKELFTMLWFDETTCRGWHLYAVDLCYHARQKFNTITTVLPDSIYHKQKAGNGLRTDNTFLITMFRMTNKYRKHFDTIFAPCYICSTHPLKAILKLTRTFLHNIIAIR